ncbi:MAG TPA: hypothetical protein DCP31_15155, partial [Cyanobacteria bacterium UBA8543]|nr:hypothetical protein [Cyanobacteria bacterium UBA8543]
MPTFPKYQGELPQCLNPFNLRHYWLLAYWVYFRPTALNCYLYQAAPECYLLRGLSKVRRTWNIRAYRSLYFMVPVAVLLLALLVGLVVGLYLLWTWQGHTASVNAVTLTPDGQQVISASADGTLKVWDAKSGQSLRAWQGHTAPVNAVTLTPDGQQAVSVSADGTMRVWDIKTGQSLPTVEGHTAPVNAVAVTPDGQQVISASLDGILRVWDLKNGKSIRTLEGHTASVNAVAVTPKGQQVVSALNDGNLIIWDAKSGQSLSTLEGHTAPVLGVAVTPDGQQAVSASADSTLRVWDLKNGTSSRALEGHTAPVNAVAVTPNGQQAISASADGTLKVWDLNSTQLQRTWRGHTSPVNAVAVTPNGQQVLSASSDGALRVWDLNSGAAVPLTRAKVSVVVLSIATVMLLLLAVINLSVVFAIVLAIAIITFGVAGSWLGGLVGSVVFSLGLATATSLVSHLVTIGNGFNTLGIPALGTASTTTFAITFCMAFGLSFSVALSSVSRRAFGVLGSAIAILFIGVLVSVAIGLLVGIQLPSESATFNEKGGIVLQRVTTSERIKTGLDTGFSIINGATIFALLGLLGTSRIPFYPFQLVLALRSQLQSRTHPVEWDELTVLPLPGTRRLISQRLQHDEATGLKLVSEVVCNPFRRTAAHKALKTYLYTQAAPLHLLYKLLTHSTFNTYILAPVSQQDWQRLPTTGQLLLGELSGEWVNCSTGWLNHYCERLAWYLTWFYRPHRQTPLTRFAGMLYNLLDEKSVNAEEFDLQRYRPIYARLTNCPGGVEIERSFEAIASFLSYKELSAIPEATDISGAQGLALLQADNTAIRPTVLTALNRLADISSEIAYTISSTRVQKLATLARATDTLKTLNDYVNAQVVAPEQTLLQRIICQWSKLVIEESATVGRVEVVEPVANPYVVDHPVTDDLFIGREDILLRLEEVWRMTEHCPSVVLYGHRSMGKSSILRNLGIRLETQTTVVDFNMQWVGLVDNTGELLYKLAIKIYDALPVALQERREEPSRKQFCDRNPYTALDRFLRHLDRVRAGQRFIVTIDEFELIEKLIEEQRLEPRLLEFWQGLIQTYPWFLLIFAGLHTLEEMTQDYWHPLLESVTAIPVSFLSPEAAKRLIEQPSPTFNLDYEPNAVEEIIKLTNGQPYLIQLIGRGLVTRFNRQTLEENIKREPRFTLEDVEAVINAPEFYQDSHPLANSAQQKNKNSSPNSCLLTSDSYIQAKPQ